MESPPKSDKQLLIKQRAKEKKKRYLQNLKAKRAETKGTVSCTETEATDHSNLNFKRRKLDVPADSVSVIPAHGAIIKLRLDEIRFSQSDIAARFNDVRLVSDLSASILAALESETVGRSPFAAVPRIRVIRFMDQWTTLDNRRLRAFIDAYAVFLFRFIERRLGTKNARDWVVRPCVDNPVEFHLAKLSGDDAVEHIKLPSCPVISTIFCDQKSDPQTKRELQKKKSNKSILGGGKLRMDEPAVSSVKKGAVSIKREKELQRAMALPTTTQALKLAEIRDELAEKLPSKNPQKVLEWSRRSFALAALKLLSQQEEVLEDS